eukprot:CFRG2689T1
MNDSGEVCEEICEEISRRQDIDWHQLDKSKFFFFGTTLFFVVRATVYPAALVKTRLQVARRNAQYHGAIATFKNIYRSDGFRGFYHGFATTALGIVPAQGLYLSTYEKVRADAKCYLPNNKHEMIRNLIAGGSASLASQMVICPVDVISQRLIVQAMDVKHGQVKRFNGGWDVARDIIKTNGVRGLYRGFMPSITMYAPSSGIWWATYGFVQKNANSRLVHTTEDGEKFRVPVQAISGMTAGMTAAVLTNPLDVLKTRIQTSRSKLGIIGTAKHLIKTEGIIGFSNGLTARLMNSAPVSILMITVYELVKRLSQKPVPHLHLDSDPNTIVMLSAQEDGWAVADSADGDWVVADAIDTDSNTLHVVNQEVAKV